MKHHHYLWIVVGGIVLYLGYKEYKKKTAA